MFLSSYGGRCTVLVFLEEWKSNDRSIHASVHAHLRVFTSLRVNERGVA